MSINETITEKPYHHVRYARAWALHQDEGISDEAKMICEREMDDAQNHFSWDEFQSFKLSLPGFVEFWDKWRKKL